jgi:hypothetical protein
MLSKIKLNLEKLARPELVHAAFLFFIISILCAAYLLPGYWYSPDSFSYYELSKTFFGENEFYEPNTIRSYFDLNHSAAFPLLYPSMLATLNFFFGDNYLNATYYNIVLMISSYFLLLNIAKNYTRNIFLSATFSLSILLFPGYIGEVLSGRSIPLSLFLFLLSFIFYQKEKINLMTLLLGFCCLVRFDFLATAIFISLFLSFKEKKATPVIFLILGLSPWIVYSLFYFNTIWVSDNSWVATSSVRANVTDFPANSSYTIFNDTFTWIQRIFKNYIYGNYSFARALFTNLLIVYIALIFFKQKKYLTITFKKYLFIFLLINSSLAPFFLSGYFDERYFYLPILMVGIFLLREKCPTTKNSYLVFIIPIISILPAKTIYYGLYKFEENKTRITQRIKDIESINTIHSTEKHVTYFIQERKGGLRISPMYGAVTGNKVAFTPRNKNDVNQADINKYIGENKNIIIENGKPTVDSLGSSLN